MENNNERDYGSNNRNPQENQSYNAPSTNEVGHENELRTPESHEDAGSTGFASGTNPDRYNSVSNDEAETAGAGQVKDTQHFSTANSDFDNWDDDAVLNAELIPDSDDLEDDEEDYDDDEEDFDDDDEGQEDSEDDQ